MKTEKSGVDSAMSVGNEMNGWGGDELQSCNSVMQLHDLNGPASHHCSDGCLVRALGAIPFFAQNIFMVML